MKSKSARKGFRIIIPPNAAASGGKLALALQQCPATLGHTVVPGSVLLRENTRLHKGPVLKRS